MYLLISYCYHLATSMHVPQVEQRRVEIHRVSRVSRGSRVVSRGSHVSRGSLSVVYQNGCGQRAALMMMMLLGKRYLEFL